MQYLAWIKKSGKDREKKPYPTQGWRERLQLNVWVCLVLILMRLEGYMHAFMWLWLFVAESFSWQGSAL